VAAVPVPVSVQCCPRYFFPNQRSKKTSNKSVVAVSVVGALLLQQLQLLQLKKIVCTLRDRNRGAELNCSAMPKENLAGEKPSLAGLEMLV
jgi:hypothetical protein